MTPEPTFLAVLLAVIGLIGALVGLVKIWQGTKDIHYLVNSNFSKMRTDLRLVLAAFFVTILVAIVAVYKAMARLRDPDKER